MGGCGWWVGGWVGETLTREGRVRRHGEIEVLSDDLPYVYLCTCLFCCIGWVLEWVEEKKAVGMRYWSLWVWWVGG